MTTVSPWSIPYSSGLRGKPSREITVSDSLIPPFGKDTYKMNMARMHLRLHVGLLNISSSDAFDCLSYST